MSSLLEPINPDNAVGNDPRYGEEFSSLKSEIGKTNNVDYFKIIHLSEFILTNQAKDLRVCAYLGLALSKQEGMPGLVKSIDLMQQLIRTYGNDLHPRSDKARRSAIAWFHQPKTMVFVKERVLGVDDAQCLEYMGLFDNYLNAVSDLIKASVSWPELKKHLNSLTPVQIEKKPLSDKIPDDVDSNKLSYPETNSHDIQKSTGLPTSNGEFQSQIRLAIRYSKDQGNYAQSVGLARTLLWSELNEPSNNQGLTALPAIDNNKLDAIRDNISNGNYLKAFLAAEDLFLSPGGLFCMELQRLASVSAEKAGYTSASRQITLHLIALNEKIPNLSKLAFNNGEPFISAGTQDWIDKLINIDEKVQVNLLTVDQEPIDASDIYHDQGLTEALTWLEQYPVKNEFDRIQVCFSRANILIEDGKSNFAYSILIEIDITMRNLNLPLVNPNFCITVWRLLYRLKKDRLAKNDVVDKNKTITEMEAIKSSVCNLNVASAIKWFS
ncbi:TssA family type VI secretion system protein [Reinekea sp.]|jgi:type VI secretion system protein VasJ|uniref:TssA family type VI secretion system protein n=1 Tax=Reinekea sp. TaxID=1970455 RepID=UPI00398975BD